MSDTTRACGLCGTVQNLLACNRCRVVYYCCKQHQVAHWTDHKRFCKEHSRSPNQIHSSPQTDVPPVNGKYGAVGYPMVTPTQPPPCTGDIVDDTNILLTSLLEETSLYDLNHPAGLDSTFLTSVTAREPGPDQPMTPAEDLQLPSEAAPSVSILPAVQELPLPHTFFPQPVTPDASVPTSAPSSVPPVAMPTPQSAHLQQVPHQTFRNKDCSLQPNEIHHHMKAKETRVADYVVDSLTNFGLCVLDNYLGETKCSQILNEVRQLDETGLMTDGQLCNTKNVEIATKIREDKITWIEKGEHGYENISNLIGHLDALIMQCNGRLEQYDINGRTKAMVACYPGNGTSYLRHVDNPNSDGRCITCIYYLNKDWDVKEHGGLLRIYPAKFHKRVADIEPIFDRVIFFWSDYRNPHEVRPAQRTRYAITVWYFDAMERAKAKMLYTKQTEKKSGAHSRQTSHQQ